jgi:glucose/mannose transport system substrate-binding protein
LATHNAGFALLPTMPIDPLTPALRLALHQEVHARPPQAVQAPLAVGAQGWQQTGLFNNLLLAIGGKDLYLKINKDHDAEAAAGPEMAKVFAALADARSMTKGANVQDWNQATNMVITAKAAAQSMGDWAQGEFQVAGQVAGTDYTCLVGLGMPDPFITTGGDSFYFPKLDDPEKSKAQEQLASIMLSPETQVAFNLKKGSMPVRGDVDLSAANDCMKKGLEVLKAGNVIQSTDELLSPDTTTQLNDLVTQFFANDSITPEQLQADYAAVIGTAD